MTAGIYNACHRELHSVSLAYVLGARDVIVQRFAGVVSCNPHPHLGGGDSY